MNTMNAAGWPPATPQASPQVETSRGRDQDGPPPPPEPRPGADDAPPPGVESKVSLGALVRRWLSTYQDVESQRHASDEEPSPTRSPGEVSSAPLVAPVPDPARVAPESVAVYPDVDRDPAPDSQGADVPPVAVPRPLLPHRRRGRTQPQLARRLAVLIDARMIPPDRMTDLFDVLADHGTVNVSRAYGDWTAPDAQEWMPQLRQHGVQPCHQFAQEADHRSLVAMTIDAVDLSREAAVDVVAVVGDLTSAYPLVQRLNAAGVAVLAFGATDTPDDVRGLCEQFTDLALLGGPRTVTAGRHRA